MAWFIHKEGNALHIQGNDLRAELIHIVGYDNAMKQLADWHPATLQEFTKMKLYEI